jgi:hypothetical protein
VALVMITVRFVLINLVGWGLSLTLAAGHAAAAQQSSAAVAGTVSVAGPDGPPVVMPGVTLTMTCSSGEPRTDVSDEQGSFRFPDAATGTCSIVAALQGFKSVTKIIALKPGETAAVSLQPELDTVREEVTVSAKADTAADSPIAAHVERMTDDIMRTAPLASERFQDALPLIPGVVRGPDGLLNINGTRSNQIGLTFNSASGTDPVTGEDAIELPIDAVSSVQVRGSAYAPEFGLSAGAVTTVETLRAGDAWHTTVNDLEPRVRRRGGVFRGVESFSPRVTIGGPIVSGSLSVLQSMQYEYSQTHVPSLPPFESDTKLESFASFSRADWRVSPTNHVTGSAIASPRKTTYAGLNTFNPQEVTPNIKNHSVLGSASDQIIIGVAGVLETRVSVNSTTPPSIPVRGPDTWGSRLT